MQSDKLDVRGKICPVPLLLAKRKLQSMNIGEIVEVISDYPQTSENIQKLVERTGNEILGRDEEGGIFRLIIRKRTSGDRT